MSSVLELDDRAPISSLQEPAKKKLTNWKKEPDITALKRDVSDSKPFQQEQITKITHWLNQRNMTGSAKLSPRKGRSRVQPKLIRKQNEWRYTSLTEPFLSSDKLFTISPRTYEDHEGAAQNELLLNWQFQTKLNPVFFIDQYIRVCVDEGTVIVRTGWERETKRVKVKVPVWGYFPMERPEQVEALMQAMQIEEANPAEYAKLPPFLQESVRYSMEKGTPHIAEEVGEEEVWEEQVLKNQPTCEVINSNNLIIDATCGGDPDKALFMAYSYETTVGALRRDKRYTNLDAVNFDGAGVLSEPDHATAGPMEVNFQDKSRKKIILHEYYGYYDIEGDGHLTPIMCCWIGNVMVRMELNPFPDGKPPFTIVPYMPIVRSVYGEPDGELLEDNQKIEGAITRGIIDLMARSANGQRGIAKNMLDPVNRRRYENGDDYEFNPNQHPANSLVEHKFPEIPQTALLMLQAQSVQAESLTGVKTFSAEGVSGASLGPTAAGVRGAIQASSLREMGILRRLAQGLATIGGKIVAMNQEFLTEEEVVRVTNEQFITIRRDELHGCYDYKVDISTAEEDNAKAQELSFMLQTLGPNLDLDMTKLIMSEIARLRRMPKLAKMIQNFQPQPDPIAQERAKLELLELQSKIDLNKAQAMAAMAKGEEAMADARKKDVEADQGNLDFVEQQTGVAHARDIDKISEQAEANSNAKIVQAVIDQRPNGAQNPESQVPDAPTAENIMKAFAIKEAVKKGF